ncbi:MAG TPA: outer membrane protein assembly factor BamA [Alphaproteobacteria bacterium]|nr:outer membrane protein assembly factor BamA [Alphaproteobacteria bacterium]
MRILIRNVIICLVLALSLTTGEAMAQKTGGGVVREIVVEGAQRIEPATVLSYLLVRKGDSFDPRRIDRSLKSLFATGLFADVNISRRGDVLVVTVVENPVINRIAFEGNSEIANDVLKDEVSLRPRVIYTRSKVQNDVRRLLSLYRAQGLFAAVVEPKIIQLPQNRVDLVFEISEGDDTVIRKIRFVGNKEFDDSRLMKVIRTKETRWYRFLSSDDTYDPDRITLDRELLRRFYLSNGYADFRVNSAVAELTPDRKDFFITYTVEEGVRYKFGKIKIDARLRNLNGEALREFVEFKDGDWYDSSEIEKAVGRLTSQVGTLGYAFVDIRPRIKRDRKDKTINIVFEVNEGPRVFVERIDISGNVRTADKVIRREFRIVEGDAFNSSKLRRSKQRINNLNFFKKVDIEQVPGSAPDKTTVKVKVKEKSTGSLSLGVGFSSSAGIVADIGLRERNLLGKGQDLKLSTQIASKRSQINLSFTEPYFMDREVAAGFDIFRTTRNNQDASSFDSKTTGGALRMGYPITERLSQSWKYTFKDMKVEKVADNASSYIKDEAGVRTISEVGHTIIYDKRNSRIIPTKGYVVRMKNELAGLGGSARYFRTVFSGNYYYPVADEWVWSAGASFGQIFGFGKKVGLLDRFFIGGDDLRGFATSGVGPRDASTSDALGGEWMYRASTELTFPLGLPAEFGMSGKIFTDMGSSGKLRNNGTTNVNDTGSLRMSAGVGINWRSPFGPLGLDIGFPILKEKFDKTELTRVNFGTRF